MISPRLLWWVRQWVLLGFLVGFGAGRTAFARTQYDAELTKLLSEQSDEEVANIAKRLRCRMCHTTEPPAQQQNVFGQEMARVLGQQRDVTDRRSIQVALHRAVFVLKNRKPSSPRSSTGSTRTVRKRYVGTVLKEASQIVAYEMPLSDVLRVLAENHEIEIQSDQRAFKRAGVSPELPISLSLSEVPLQSLLKFLLAEHHLTFDIKDNGLVVRPLEPHPEAASSRLPASGKADAPAPNLAKTLASCIGQRIQVTEKNGTRMSETLLKLHQSKDGKLEALSLFSTQSSSRRRYVPLSEVKEIRYRNQALYSQNENKNPVVGCSRQLEQEMLQRERIPRRERLQAAYRRQAGRERVADSLRRENGRLSLNPREAEELGESEQVVRALATLATDQAAQNRPDSFANIPPADRPTAPPADRPTERPATHRTEEPTPPPPSPELPRKSVVLKYRTSTGMPPALRYGTRIRYETADPQDPKVQQGELDAEGQCELDVPEDVKSIQVYTTPFGGSEGIHFLNSKGPSTLTIRVEGV